MTRPTPRAAALAAALSAILAAAACTSSSPTGATSTKPSTSTSKPTPRTATTRAAEGHPALPPAAEAAGVVVSAIPDERAKKAAHDSVVIIALPERPEVGTDSSGKRALMRVGHTYRINFAVDIETATGIRITARNAEVTGTEPFLATPGHRYRVSADLVPSAGRGTYTLQLFDPASGHGGSASTAYFDAR